MYDSLSTYTDGFAVVSSDGKYGFIDTNGKILVPIKYDSAQPFSEGFAAVSYNNKWGVINTNGQLIIKLKYEGIGPCVNGMMAVPNDRPRYYITPSDEKIKPIY